MTKCESATLQAFLVALLNQLAVARAALSDAQQGSKDSIAKLPDDSELIEPLITTPVVKLSEPLPLLAHKPPEIGPSASTAIPNPEAAGRVGLDRIQLIQVDKQCAALKEKTQRLRSELTPRKNVERPAMETGEQRIEKLHALNERLVTEVRTLQQQSSSAESSKQILREKLDPGRAECDRLRHKNEKLAPASDQLFRDHRRLRDEFKRTWKASWASLTGRPRGRSSSQANTHVAASPKVERHPARDVLEASKRSAHVHPPCDTPSEQVWPGDQAGDQRHESR
jgi:hypothetical protein